MKSAAILSAAALLVSAAACAPPGSGHALFYVSPGGDGSNGLSWATAWRDTSLIDWSVIRPGSEIIIDGGASPCRVSPYDFRPPSGPGTTCGERYHPLSIHRNGITVERSAAAGHDGTVVIDGGRDTPLPYCGQKRYSAPAEASSGIDLNGHSGVVINGMARGGIVVRGAQNGVVMRSGDHNALLNMEIFDNGFAVAHSWGYSSDGNGVLMGGRDNVYDRLLVHDNGQDEFHSDSSGYDESGSALYNSWLGAIRAHPRHPDEPFNDLQESGHDPGCTHADGLQIFAPGIVMSGLTLDHDVVGPGVNTGLYPSDRGTGARFNDVTIKNSLFLSAASTDILADTRVHDWDLSRDTIIALHGALSIPGNGGNTMTGVIKSGGYVFTPGGSWNGSGNVWWGGDRLPGAAAHVNPGFRDPPAGLAGLRAASFRPAVKAGSPLHSWAALLKRIDSLDSTW